MAAGDGRVAARRGAAAHGHARARPVFPARSCGCGNSLPSKCHRQPQASHFPSLPSYPQKTKREEWGEQRQRLDRRIEELEAQKVRSFPYKTLPTNGLDAYSFGATATPSSTARVGARGPLSLQVGLVKQLKLVLSYEEYTRRTQTPAPTPMQPAPPDAEREASNGPLCVSPPRSWAMCIHGYPLLTFAAAFYRAGACPHTTLGCDT